MSPAVAQPFASGGEKACLPMTWNWSSTVWAVPGPAMAKDASNATATDHVLIGNSGSPAAVAGRHTFAGSIAVRATASPSPAIARTRRGHVPLQRRPGGVGGEAASGVIPRTRLDLDGHVREAIDVGEQLLV